MTRRPRVIWRWSSSHVLSSGIAAGGDYGFEIVTNRLMKKEPEVADVGRERW